MIKNFQEIVSQIKTQVPIQELISEFIPVKKSGRGYVAICPFHDDHKPSLQIHPQKGIFKCFACGTGGDLIAFYALINKKKWSEVIPELALKYGLKVEYGDENKTETQIKNQLYDLNRVTLDFFKRNLFSSDGEETLNYLKSTRKLSNDFIEKYELGKAQNSWDSLFNYLSKEKQYPHELILTSGLFLARENQNGYYDRFRNRVIVPIYNENNNIVGFGGRALVSEEVKYINSPETLIFSKGQILYGLNFAREEIKKLDYAILTEGYFDVITAHQHGLLNTVATLGTALTPQQARLLTKYTDSKKIYLCLDSDVAGKKAIEGIFKLAQEINQFVTIDLRVTTNLPAKDLDESLNIEDSKIIKNKIETGQKIMHFIFDRLTKEYFSASNEGAKKSVFDELIEIVTANRDPLEQKECIQYISHKLNIEEDLINAKIKNQVNAIKQRKSKFQKMNPKTEDDLFKMHSDERFKHAELELLCLYISSFPSSLEIRQELSQFQFVDDKHLLIKEFLDSIAQTKITPQEVINQLIIQFNEYKHVMSAISDLAWRIETEESSYSKNKEKILKEAKEWITWWVMNKQKMKTLTDLLKDCKTGEEETNILSQMISLVKKETKT